MQSLLQFGCLCVVLGVALVVFAPIIAAILMMF
jgi:hypothetical protein